MFLYGSEIEDDLHCRFDIEPYGDMIYTSLKLLNLLKANLAGMFFEWFILCYADKKKIKIEKWNRTQLESNKNMFFLEIAMTKSTVNTYVNMDNKLGGYRHK
jgi:hypothetical protein